MFPASSEAFYEIARPVFLKLDYNDTLLIEKINRENIFPITIERRRRHFQKACPLPFMKKHSFRNAFLLVTQEGFEPTTHRLEGGCSIQLSY